MEALAAIYDTPATLCENIALDMSVIEEVFAATPQLISNIQKVFGSITTTTTRNNNYTVSNGFSTKIL